MIESQNTYPDSLHSLYRKYIQDLSELNLMNKKQLEQINSICNQIYKIAISTPDYSYEKMIELMENSPLKNHLFIIKDELPIDGFGRKNRNLFRTRRSERRVKYTRKELFHPPFNCYSSIKSYRYNIENCPSLYLSSTIECTFNELNIGPTDLVTSSLFRLNKASYNNLYIIDLATRPRDYIYFGKNKPNNNYKYSDYLFVYPLIAACSYIDSEPLGNNACNEYAVSQALSKWIFNNSRINERKLKGIRYFSCYDSAYSIINSYNISQCEDYTSDNFTKLFVNYAFFPEKSFNKSDIFSPLLKEYFLVSIPTTTKSYKNISDCKMYETSLKRKSSNLSSLNFEESK